VASSFQLARRPASQFPSTVLRVQSEFGFQTVDLVHPPHRLLPLESSTAPLVEQGVDIRRVEAFPTPAKLLQCLPEGDNWSAQSKRTLAKVSACFLVGEDPQRRLDAREVSTLSHQVSLVRHVLDNEKLRRVLIADEVGLGKTVEVALILKELLERTPQLRILYLAPARLVTNVRREFDRMKMGFRQWSSNDGDARLSDSRIIASIHRAVNARHVKAIVEEQPWDVIVVDECHHLSDWAQGGGDPKEKFKLVRELLQRQSAAGRVLFLSGTPHQGHTSRFENLIGLLRGKTEKADEVAGRVIYRTKDDVRDWDGNLLFPRRKVKEPIVVDLGPQYRAWIARIHDFFSPTGFEGQNQSNKRRVAGWRCAQALQWAASSPQAGVGYLVRQAIRAGFTLSDEVVKSSIAALRPYRGGATDEPVEEVFRRMVREVGGQDQESDDDSLEDIEDSFVEEFEDDSKELREVLSEGLVILKESADAKWRMITERILNDLDGEKAVLFAQPIETVTAFANYLERTTGRRPALIIGGQSDSERENEVKSFLNLNGPQFLVSSRAGGEGINLQISRRLVHIDVPWNPMDMEQRVGRVHRFGSRKTIIVDTLVVKDSREEHAYRVARDKLKSITETMVEPERFEQVFSRVMSLVPPEELINVLSNSPLAPLTDGDQEIIARVVREGFSAWQEFDKRFAESQKLIRHQNPGLASWEDVSLFLETAGKWKKADGFVKQKFAWVEGELEPTEEAALVLQAPDGRFFTCGDQGGIPVFGPGNEQADQLGLNLPDVRSLLSGCVFPLTPTGAFYVRWPFERPRTMEGLEQCFAFVFLKQSVRTDQNGWSECGLEFCGYLWDLRRGQVRIQGDDLRQFLRNLQASTPRVKAPSLGPVIEQLLSIEDEIIQALRPPTEEEFSKGIRHAIFPIACGVIDFEK
jgi:superfamily II DNA or RNA helicase